MRPGNRQKQGAFDLRGLMDKKEKSKGDQPVRKADFDDLEKRFWEFREMVLNDIAEIVKQIHAKKGAYSDK